MNKQTIITILLAFVVSSLMAQPSDPKGLYKLSEIIHQDGKHLEAQFKQYKFCLDKYSLTVGYNSVIFPSEPVDFGLSNPDGKPLQFTGELSKTENKGIQLFSTSDSTFTLRWFNDRSAFNEHLFPYGTNIDEIYEQVKDSDDVMLRSIGQKGQIRKNIRFSVAARWSPSMATPPSQDQICNAASHLAPI